MVSEIKVSSHKKSSEGVGAFFHFYTFGFIDLSDTVSENPNFYKIGSFFRLKTSSMKNLVTIVIWLGVVSIGFSQKIKGDEVPQVVSTAFAKVYSNVKNLKWEKEGEGFEASFDNQKEEMSVLLDATGKIKEVETEIELSALPVAVKNSLAKDFADYKIKEAAKIVSENVTTYEAEGKKGKESFDFLFSEDGKLIKKVDTKKKVKNQS